jgi:RimJ/RimL family protein N-acetyltransferase
MPKTEEAADALRGEFVTLRPLRESDAELTLRWRRSERAALLNGGASTVEAQAEWIRARPQSERNFVIELADGRPVGMLSLVGIDRRNRHAESARFLIGDEDAVRGVPAAVEAMKLLYGLAFDELGLERVWGTVASDNRRMVKWQRYLGMREEGRLRNHYFIGDRFQDAVCLGILAEEYRGQALPRMQSLIAAGRKEPIR